MTPIYEYSCIKCDISQDVSKPMAQSEKIEKCPVCSAKMRKIISSVAISGTRDTFGIGKEFVDEKTGVLVDNWRTHEKLGYVDAKEYHSNSHNKIKEGITRKVKKIRREGTQKMQSTLV